MIGKEVLILRGKQKGRKAIVLCPGEPYYNSNEPTYWVDLQSWTSFWDRRRVKYNLSALEVL